jgi:hypothetical protein
MGDYLLMVLEDEAAHARESPRAMAELIEQRAAFADGLRGTGELHDAGRLRPSKEGRRVRRRGGELTIEPGPFAGEKALAGYLWVSAPTIDAAARVGLGCPSLPSDELEVRPLMKGKVADEQEAKPGKIFAFAVHGKEATEQAWVEVMDRIDAETHELAAQAFTGGLRLEPPRVGKRIATRGGARALFDGPFLESKEVIGGLFFLRLTSLEEATEWAAATPFVVHGALEIRELWRS